MNGNKKFIFIGGLLILIVGIIIGLGNLILFQRNCQYNGKTYKQGEGFKSSDGCNTCSCTKGKVACTLMACPQNVVANYNCDGKKTISATFITGEAKEVVPGEMPIPTGSVQLKLSDGRNMTLNQTISADGGRYANEDESFIFWDKGNSTFVMEGNKTTYQNCGVVRE